MSEYEDSRFRLRDKAFKEYNKLLTKEIHDKIEEGLDYDSTIKCIDEYHDKVGKFTTYSPIIISNEFMPIFNSSNASIEDLKTPLEVGNQIEKEFINNKRKRKISHNTVGIIISMTVLVIILLIYNYFMR